jgi:hypothetical protein
MTERITKRRTGPIFHVIHARGELGFFIVYSAEDRRFCKRRMNAESAGRPTDFFQALQ